MREFIRDHIEEKRMPDGAIGVPGRISKRFRPYIRISDEEITYRIHKKEKGENGFVVKITEKDAYVYDIDFNFKNF